jgi:hypothetical protein
MTAATKKTTTATTKKRMTATRRQQQQQRSILKNHGDENQRVYPTKKLAPASASKGKTNKIDDPAMQEFIKWFNVAKICGDGHVGFDFGAIFPYMWFWFTHNNCNYIQMEIALSSTHPDDLTNTISDDGKHVILKNVVPNTLIDP